MSVNSKGAVDVDAVMSSILVVMEEETGLSAANLLAAENMAAIGVDSLLSLTLLHRCRRELQLALPGDLFSQNRSLAQVKEALGAAL